jgi:hypothetical protein
VRVASGGCFAKCGNGTAASSHRGEHLVMREIEEVVAWLEPKELEQGRISTRWRRPASTQRSRGKKWRGGPWFGCVHAEEGVGGPVQCVVHGRRRGGGPDGVKRADAVACQ